MYSTPLVKLKWWGVFMLILVLHLSVHISAIYVILNEGQKRCLIEEVPTDTLIVVRWKAEELKIHNPPSLSQQKQQLQQEPKLGVKITVRDPFKNLVNTKDGMAEGRYAFTSTLGGEYQLCFQINVSRWFGSLKTKLTLDIESGASAVDYEEIARLEHLTELQIEVRKLNDQVREILKEQNYLKAREIEARDESEKTNSRVIWWSFAETTFLVVSGFWQIRHLKNFFLQKKLV